MPVPKLLIAVIVSLLTGFGVAAWFTAESEIGRSTPTEDLEQTVGSDEDAAVEDRLRSLELAMNTERQARQLLEDELLVLYETLDAIEARGEESRVASAESRLQQVPPEARVRANRGLRNDSDERLQALTDAGFSSVRAEWIVQRESALQMQVMQNRYEAVRSGQPVSQLRQMTNADQLLRDEIGDVEFEQYLQASGRSTSVGVARINGASPARSAGLQPGDQITHYDGARVFNTRQLIQQTMQGNPGENVVVSIVRNGAPIQVVMPRGPLGINTTGGR